jgi:crotonobetainyl-CoA:carnitine CoA-transferase CaiB-like acyl-CoA transferase
MTAPLEGLKVLELARVLAGPWAGQLLADLGADVIKIERPGSGDDTRGWGPPFVEGAEGKHLDSAYYHAINRGKRSVTADFHNEKDRDFVRKLATEADVVIENYKVGDLAKYGLDYSSLKQINPALVYCSVTGFGQTGPYAPQPGYDFIIQGMGGLMSITGDPDGAPMKVGVPISDIMAGMYATVSILAALRERDSTGKGRRIDISLLDCQAAWLYNQASNYFVGGAAPKRHGNAHPNIVPYETFPTADGHINLGVGNDGQFGRLCAIIRRPELAEDPRFRTNTLRLENRSALIEALRSAFRERTSAEWLEACIAAGVPCGPINTIPEVFEDPHVKARGLVQEIRHASDPERPLRLVGSPIRMEGVDLKPRRAPPMLGQHTEEVLDELLGYDSAAIAELRGIGIV